MSATVRMREARAFYRLLEEIGFDEAMSCFADPSYEQRLPREFFQAPERYVSAVSEGGATRGHREQ